MITHFKQRADAVTIGRDHLRREYVPTVYGQPEGNTIWVDTWAQMRAVGGCAHWNEDQTEITLTLPEQHKFSIQFPKEAKKEGT